MKTIEGLFQLAFEIMNGNEFWDSGMYICHYELLSSCNILNDFHNRLTLRINIFVKIFHSYIEFIVHLLTVERITGLTIEI